MPTGSRPVAKPSPWMAITGRDNRMPSTAPNPAPADTPRLSGDTCGSVKIRWAVVPAAERAAPTRRAARHAKDIGRHQRIAEERENADEGRRESRTDQQRRQHARQADLEQDRIDR